MDLDVIAAVVIGGASLTGGRGTALNTIIGVLVLGIIGNFLNLQNVPGYQVARRDHGVPGCIGRARWSV